MGHESVFFLLLTPFLAACPPPSNQPIITPTSLKTMSIQTTEFEASKEISFRATVSVFQDLGYNIQSADLATGFISARSPIRGGFVLFVGQVQRFTAATAFVEVLGASRSKIRLNFVSEMKSSSGYGMAGGESKPVEDPETYQKAFDAIRKAIFIRKNAFLVPDKLS